MTRQEAIAQGEQLAQEIATFKSTLDPTTTFALPGDKLIAICTALETSARAFVGLLSDETLQ